MSMFFIFATFFSTLISFSAALSEYANSRWYKRSLHKKWPFNLFAMLTLCTLLICSINNFWERKWCNKDVTLCSPTARTIFKRSNQVRFLTITEPRQLRSNYFGTVCTRKVWHFFFLHDLIVTTCVSFFQSSERVFSSKLKFSWRLCLRFDLTNKKRSFKIVSLPQHAFWKLINAWFLSVST